MRNHYHLRRVWIGLSLALAFTGCVRYPLGVTREQWEALPPDRQADYRAQQTQLDEARYTREAAAAQERRRLADEEVRLDRERSRAAYATARWGDVVTVTISGGQIAFNGKRYPYEPVAFDLIRGETKWVEFNRQNRPGYSTKIEMRLSEDGNTFYFDASARKRAALINTGWAQGRSYNPPEMRASDGRSEAVGLTIHVHLKELPGAPRRLIIEHR